MELELRAARGPGQLRHPRAQATQLLHDDHDVAAGPVSTSPPSRSTASCARDRASPNAAVGPPILSGHGFDAPDQVVLGENTLAQLHKHIGDTVEVAGGTGNPTRYESSVPPPAHHGGAATHPTMGTGAVISDTLIPIRPAPFASPTGPNHILVRLRDGANPPSHCARSTRSLQQRHDRELGVTVVKVQRPAEIVNYRSMGSIPVLLGAALAAGAVAALGLTLIASVRRRRHDLALLKTIGFTRRQLSATIAWQATIAVAIGTIIGIPVGILIGRLLWDVFARAIDVVPQPTVSIGDHAHRRWRPGARQSRRRHTRPPSRPHPHSRSPPR